MAQEGINEGGRIWVPEDDDRWLSGDSIQEVVDAYSVFLEVRHPDHKKHFHDRLAADPDSAKAEAVVFSWLRLRGSNPQVAESPSTGGTDYLCVPESNGPFLIEVTSLNRDAVEQRSGWPDQLDERAHAFSMITPNLWSKARTKAPQLGNHAVPRVLAITLAHIGASALLGTLAAEWMMMSEPKIQVPIALSGQPGPTRTVSDLRKAAFIRLQNHAVVPVLQSISAVLLIAIWDTQLEVVGLLHPEPAVPLDYGVFDDVPFLRVEWPVRQGILRREWVVAHPGPARYYHIKVRITDAELRGE